MGFSTPVCLAGVRRVEGRCVTPQQLGLEELVG
ncbi:hypothetical protein ERO13_A06G038250v2 [Gossypium hirsutum]|nr:hypothetical protein ERO13_A06G038250v2 [Gossypium hirsutum]